MKFPRNARISRSHLDAAPFACVFFLLVIFTLLFTLPGSLLYTPGVAVRVQPPGAGDLPGTGAPSITVALDAGGRIYFDNRLISESEFTNRLQEVVKTTKKTPEPLTLVVQADKAVKEDTLIRIAMLARGAGINNLLLATLPAVLDGSIYSRGAP